MSPTRSTGPTNWRFPGGLTLATTDLDDINLDDVDQSLRQPLKRLAPTLPTSNQAPLPYHSLHPHPVFTTPTIALHLQEHSSQCNPVPDHPLNAHLLHLPQGNPLPQ